jgi:hypothetical protein
LAAVRRLPLNVLVAPLKTVHCKVEDFNATLLYLDVAAPSPPASLENTMHSLQFENVLELENVEDDQYARPSSVGDTGVISMCSFADGNVEDTQVHTDTNVAVDGEPAPTCRLRLSIFRRPFGYLLSSRMSATLQSMTP